MITAENISKRFGRYEAVKDVSIHVKKGSIYGLLGSNGAGKTTFLKIITGIMRPDKGAAKIGEAAVYEQPEVKERTIFIPDQPYFFQQSTLMQMAAFYKAVYTRWNDRRFVQLYEHFGLDPHAKLSRMSKGMQRQAAFILTLSAMPDVLVLDEPFDGLDPVVRQQVKNLLIQDVSEREMTVIVSSHNLREMEDFCDSVGIMHKGGLLFERELEELKTDICKVQVAFRQVPDQSFLDGLNLLHYEKRGRVFICIVRGQEEGIERHVQSFEPAIFDILPLTLEEIFTYEMGSVGYEIRNLIV
ncbi:ABC transporter ATP-binding protein [Pseudobacillus badius]|uniref:ABC transporter ATP-binding protein n=1 Tax=Bacillus badius TaxID=1455 RepID=UPI0007B050F7|nr:ABC transporter ATP-binding protein [Bacillus badius]KZO01287.1 ABC transporter [Bacillus badius]MED0665136.1 ABC transporter ATP-binding protein [Bacillus badius]OCS89525.1 ABC transporter [Bacillus badius]OVE49951.1 ABC transporter [Bacillus badius]TDW01097.1 ABC-2 type transport system ATP-binding protein [Bacillus badius]